jgi:hypothetical protein
MAGKKVTVNQKIAVHNVFCNSVYVGDILYNLNSTGEHNKYYVVTAKKPVKIADDKSLVITMAGIKKGKDNFVPTSNCLILTYSDAAYTQMLKPVGHCKFNFSVSIKDPEINKGLVVVYDTTNMKDYVKYLPLRKPKRRKYSDDGNLIKND